MNDTARLPQVGVGAVVWRGDEVLIIKRGRPPRMGEWSIPGGRIQWGETLEDAVHREVREETGCTIEIIGLCEVAESMDAGHHIVLIDFTAVLVDGEPRAGDDAAEAHFIRHNALDELEMWDETRRMIELSRAQLQAVL